MISPPTGWAELFVHKRKSTVQRTSESRSGYTTGRWQEDVWAYATPDTLHVYDAAWKNDFICHRTPGENGLTFTVRSHGNGKYDTGGHNWYMTTRFDVWFTHPDGWMWYGALITGGDNSTFKVRRTKESRHLFPPLPRLPDGNFPRCGTHPLRHRFQSPVIEPAEADTLRVADGKVTLWFAKEFRTGWAYAPTLNELFANRMLNA